MFIRAGGYTEKMRDVIRFLGGDFVQHPFCGVPGVWRGGIAGTADAIALRIRG